MSVAFKLVAAGCVLALLCCSCAGEARRPPSIEVPPAFENKRGDNAAAWPAAAWLHQFASADLDALVALAETGNLDIDAAAARVRQADARARASGAAFLPQVDVGGNALHTVGRAGGASAHETDWSALVSASYEVDFWGRNRAGVTSADNLSLASRADLATLRVTTLGGVANMYFQVLSLRERTQLAQLNLNATRAVLEFMEARFAVGMANPAELASQKAALANAEIAIPPLQQQESETRAALAVLLGRAPEGFVIKDQTLDSLTEPAIDPGLPSELLLRRPDVLAAESLLESAHADLAVARAALFPSLSLTAGGGLQNPGVQAAVTTLAGTGYSLTVGAALLQTLFDGGRRRAVIEEAAAREQELVANYRLAILNALRDVEISLAAIHSLDLQRRAQHDNVAQSERAAEGAQLRFREGASDYLSVLDSQRILFAAREQFSQYKLARLQASVSLAKALGGGWQRANPDSARLQPTSPMEKP